MKIFAVSSSCPQERGRVIVVEAQGGLDCQGQPADAETLSRRYYSACSECGGGFGDFVDLVDEPTRALALSKCASTALLFPGTLERLRVEAAVARQQAAAELTFDHLAELELSFRGW